MGGSSLAFEIMGGRPDADSLVWRAEGSACGFPRDRIRRLLHAQAARHNCGEQARRNIDLLEDARARIVLCQHCPDVLGGPLANLVQVLSAVRLAGELTARGTPAFPLLWLDEASGFGASRERVGILDGQSRFRNLLREGLPAAGNGGREHWVIAGAGPALDLLRDIPGLREAADRSRTDREVWGPAIAALAEKGGLVVVDPWLPDWQEAAAGLPGRPDRIPDRPAILERRRMELRSAGYDVEGIDFETLRPAGSRPGAGGFPLSLPMMLTMLPVGAIVLHPVQFCGYALVKPLLHRFAAVLPPAWPRASVTMLDARSRKIMLRNGIGFSDLFARGPGLAERLAPSEDGDAVASEVARLQSVMHSRISDLLVLSGVEGAEAEAIKGAKERIDYQLGKLQQRFKASFRERRTILRRQVGRLLDTLAPGGRLQEEAIWGLYFVRQYSPAVVDRLLEELEVLRFEHQLIDVN